MHILLNALYEPMIHALCRGFQEEGFRVDLVGEADQVVARSLRRDYDVLVLDLLPHQELSTVQQWREQGLQLPVLVLMFSIQDSEPAPSWDRGVQKVLEKPCPWSRLLASLGELLSRK